jgi:hypothetical protein
VEARWRGEESDADVGLIWTLDNGGFVMLKEFRKATMLDMPCCYVFRYLRFVTVRDMQLCEHATLKAVLNVSFSFCFYGLRLPLTPPDNNFYPTLHVHAPPLCTHRLINPLARRHIHPFPHEILQCFCARCAVQNCERADAWDV